MFPEVRAAKPPPVDAPVESGRVLLPGLALSVAGGLLLLLAPSTSVTLLSLALVVAAAALRPVFGLALLSLSLPFYLLLPRGIGSMSFSMPELVLVATAVGAALHAAWEWRRGRPARAARLATPLDGAAGLFLLAALLSLLASEVLRVSLRELRLLVLEPLVAYYLVAWFVRRGGDLRLILGGLILGGLAAAALGIYQYAFTDHVIAVEGARRILGPYLSPNHLGLYLGRIFPLALALALFVPGVRVAAGAAALLLGLALVLTFSLGTWLAVLVATLAVGLLWQRRLAPIFAAGAALVVASLPLLGLERIASHFDPSRGSSFIRLQLWESSVQMIRDHPVLGVGMDNFLYHYRSGYMLPGATAEPNLSHPHNLVLGFWLQMGVLGLLAAGWVAVVLVRLWRGLWAASPALVERAFLAGVAGAMVDVVVHGMVDQSYFLVDLAYFFWISAGALVALQKQRTLPRPRQMG